MFEEERFKAAYRAAYDRVVPDGDFIRRLEERSENRRTVKKVTQGSGFSSVRTLGAVCGAFCLLIMLGLPAMARAVPAVYDVLARFAPGLADYILPAGNVCTRRGITMQVEAIHVEGTTAEVLISFSDEDGSGTLINGDVDLTGGYYLESDGGESSIGGCSFLEYNAAEGKAYFKVNVTSYDEFARTHLRFGVQRIMTRCSQEERQISLENTLCHPELKEMVISGRSGGSFSDYSQFFGMRGDDPPRHTALVMDLPRTGEGLADGLSVVGIGYDEGLLRVQSCRGNLENADRHMIPLLTDAEGNEKERVCIVYWKEEVNGERLSFEEEWFDLGGEEPEKLQLEGSFFVSEGCVEGNWEVDLRGVER